MAESAAWVRQTRFGKALVFSLNRHENNATPFLFFSEWASYGHDGGGECGVPYSARFHMPGAATAGTGTAAPPTRNLWYSVEVGVVHFTYISTEHNFLTGERSAGNEYS
jgi:hypothetical protein